MTMDLPVIPARRIGPGTWLGFAILAAAGAALGAWFEWRFWHPSSQLAYVFAAPVVAGVGIVLALVRPLPTLVRFGTVALAVGFAAGALFGPNRPVLIDHHAELVLHLTAPFEAEATAAGTCRTVADGDQLFVADDSTFVFGEGADGVHIGVAVRSGDMWDPRSPNADGIGFTLRSSPNLIPADAAGAGETEMMSTSASTLSADVEGLEGSLSFAGLELADLGGGAINGPAIDFEGTLEWSCGPAL